MGTKRQTPYRVISPVKPPEERLNTGSPADILRAWEACLIEAQNRWGRLWRVAFCREFGISQATLCRSLRDKTKLPPLSVYLACIEAGLAVPPRNEYMKHPERYDRGNHYKQKRKRVLLDSTALKRHRRSRTLISPLERVLQDQIAALKSEGDFAWSAQRTL
jgi:hypothetical protein